MPLCWGVPVSATWAKLNLQIEEEKRWKNFQNPKRFFCWWESCLHSFGACRRKFEGDKSALECKTFLQALALMHFLLHPLWEGCSIYEGQLYFACTLHCISELYCIVFHLWPGGTPAMAKMGRSSGLRTPLPVTCWVMDLPLNQTMLG